MGSPCLARGESEGETTPPVTPGCYPKRAGVKTRRRGRKRLYYWEEERRGKELKIWVSDWTEDSLAPLLSLLPFPNCKRKKPTVAAGKIKEKFFRVFLSPVSWKFLLVLIHPATKMKHLFYHVVTRCILFVCFKCKIRGSFLSCKSLVMLPNIFFNWRKPVMKSKGCPCRVR